MNYTRDILQDVARLGALSALESLGISAGEISQRKARKVYGKWFKEMEEAHKILPVRGGSGRTGTIWYSVSDIIALRTSQKINAQILIK